MTRGPDFSHVRPNPALDGFRERTACAVLPDGRAGVIYVESVPVAHQISGHLWWARWSDPTEAACLYYDLPDDEAGDLWIREEDLPREVADWRAGRYEGMSVRGRPPRVYALTWLDEEQSEQVRRTFIGEQDDGRRDGAPPA